MRVFILRILLAGLTAVLAINLWTGAPLFAIWVGSRVQKGTGLTMSTVLVVMVVLAATVALLVLALTRVEAAYKAVTGQETHRRTAPWLRSMRDERAEFAERKGLTGFEKGLTAAVVLGVVAFEGWFFFFAGSSIG
jgi:hypothetical protein